MYLKNHNNTGKFGKYRNCFQYEDWPEQMIPVKLQAVAGVAPSSLLDWNIGMKKLAVAVSVLAASAAAASAADMPVKARPVIAAGLDWSGVYIGAHAGYGGGMNDWTSIQPAVDFVARGALVGGQVGINKQLGSFVFGLELDGSWADIKGTGATVFGGPALAATVETRATSNDRKSGYLRRQGRHRRRSLVCLCQGRHHGGA